MQLDYRDLRFLEGESSGELRYWIESYTSTGATIWVKRVENADNLIYLYYGNPRASGVSNWASTILPYVDSRATPSAPWEGRVDFASVVYEDKIWIFGGYNGKNNLNDVWCSGNGVDWTLVTGNAGWSPRRGHTAVVFDNRMWVLGGPDSSVWYSTDGKNWFLATSSPGWSARWGHTSAVFNKGCGSSVAMTVSS